jgi:hypothetical protein
MMRDPIVASTQYGWHDTHYPRKRCQVSGVRCQEKSDIGYPTPDT